jgi:hypothetical protein
MSKAEPLDEGRAAVHANGHPLSTPSPDDMRGGWPYAANMLSGRPALGPNFEVKRPQW